MYQPTLLLMLSLVLIRDCGSFFHSKLQRTFAVCTNAESAFSLYTGKFEPPNLAARMEKGIVNINELDRAFNLNSFEVDIIKRPLSKSFVGFIISLEGGLVDVADIFVASFALFADDLNKNEPNPKEVVDLIGSEFREMAIGLGFSIKDKEIPKYEERFYVIMKKVIQKMSVDRLPGCDDFVKEAIDDGNQITVITALPRDIAIMLLGKSKLSPLFEGKISPDNLVHHTIQNATKGDVNYGYGQPRHSSKVVECCYRMKKPPTLILLIDKSRRNIVAGKRLGISCVALRGYSANMQFLRPADLILDSYSKFSLREAYQIVRKAVTQADGPGQQAASIPIRTSNDRLLTSSPMQDRRAPKDTFAEELGSDMF